MNWYKTSQENVEDYEYDLEMAKNPNTSQDILRKILLRDRGWHRFIIDKALKNPNCPPDVLKTMLERRDKEDWIWASEIAAANPNCPVDAIEEVVLEELEKENQTRTSWVSQYAALNPNCPFYLLEKILQRGRADGLSECASENPNCPPKLKIDWMRSVGKIGQFDPSKHIMESDEKEIKEDEDLKKLRDLIAKSGSWYKSAQVNEDYYNIETASNPKTNPEILKEILEHGKDDIVSRYAAYNPNCPSSDLEMVLKREKDDWVSGYASQNPNCPGSALEMVLKRGKDDYVSRNASKNPNCPAQALEMVLKRGIDDVVSRYAANNKNCPASALEMVLKRGKDDFVSRYAAENPNCPLKARIKWMMATGKIGKEDPTKHIIEREEIEVKEDPDLQKLRDLVSKSNNWYKKAQINEELTFKDWIANLITPEIANDPNTNPEILKKILEQGNNDWVSYYASENPNCPLKARITWMQLTGRIGKEDPSKHIIEREEIKEDEEDEDLKKLRALISKSGSWYKSAEEDYYNEETAKDSNTSPEILKKILEKGNNDNVSCFAAQNPNCPASALEMILKRGNDDGVSHYAATNPNCPGSALEMVLKQGNNDYVSYYAAKNPNCPALTKINWMRLTGKIGKEDPTKHIIEREEIKEDEDLQKLRSLISKSGSWYKKAQENEEDDYTEKIADNFHTSPDILRKILEKGNDDPVSYYAAKNLNCPISSLEMVLRRGNDDDVSYSASMNPNCPSKAKIDWMRSTGKIGWKEFKIIKEKEETVVPKIEEYDLDAIEDVQTKSNSLYKTAKEDYYNIETAVSPNTSPEILKKILKKVLEQGNDDYISCAVAQNPSCPPEMLAEILKRGKNDIISWYAARNPNCPTEALVDVLKLKNDNYVSRNAAYNPSCPPEMLAEILRRGNDDGVSRWAAENPKCPSEILVEILERGKDDNVSLYASENPSCPALSKIQWMQLTGKIEKEDPSKHIIEKEEIKEDPDLQKLRDLIASNKNWYKKAEIRGEWWIIDGRSSFADGDIGEMNHEAYVINYVASKYAYDEFIHDDWVDWDGFKKKLAKEEYDKELTDNEWKKYQKIIDVNKLAKNALTELGMTEQEINIVEGREDAREYGIELGWKRIRGNNIETWNLTENDLKQIADGIYDIENEIKDEEEFDIDVRSNKVFYSNVPWSILSQNTPSFLLPYRKNY